MAGTYNDIVRRTQEPPGFDTRLIDATLAMRDCDKPALLPDLRERFELDKEPQGEPVVHLGPGSFMMQAGGDYRHRTSCDTNSDCVFFVESAGGFDMFAVEEVNSR